MFNDTYYYQTERAKGPVFMELGQSIQRIENFGVNRRLGLSCGNNDGTM